MTERASDAGALHARLLEKASQDAAFRQKLLAAPKAAIEQAWGVTLPLGIEIQVMEETPNRICLVLPMQETGELTDEQLATVAGGTEELFRSFQPAIGLQRLSPLFMRGALPEPIP